MFSEWLKRKDHLSTLTTCAFWIGKISASQNFTENVRKPFGFFGGHFTSDTVRNCNG
jgi:hypothetical protein